MSKEELKRGFMTTPAFDYILTDEGDKRYGRGSSCMIVWVEGEYGKVTYEINTNWMLECTTDYFKQKILDTKDRILLDICVGARPRILYVDLNEKYSNKDFPNYVDRYGYGCYKEECLCKLLVSKGSEELYKELENIYYENFERL